MADMTYTWDSPPPEFKWKYEGNGEAELEGRVPAWGQDSVKYGSAAGVDPRLVMAIVYNEGGDTPQALRPGLDLGRETVPRGILPGPGGSDGNSLGLTNMKKPTFEKLKAKYPKEFGDSEWSDLIGNDHLAIKATAWNLRRLKDELTPEIPAAMKARYSLNQILAAGYNSEANFYTPDDGYLRKGALGDHVSAYVVKAMDSFNRADSALGKMYTWKDVVAPGMPSKNPIIDPNDPNSRIVDIPPTGGYPNSNNPGYIAGQVGVPVLPRIGPNQLPVSALLGRAIAPRLRDPGVRSDLPLVQALNHDANTLAELAFPQSGLASTLELLRPIGNGGPVDRAMKINVSTPEVDTAFQRARIWDQQRALTYGGRWG